MKLLADESVDQPIVRALRHDGHNVYSITESKSGISDDEVLALANSDERTLLTADKDFGELVFRLNRIHFGVILIRLTGLSAQLKNETACIAVREHGAEMINAFSVISPGALRVRRGS